MREIKIDFVLKTSRGIKHTVADLDELMEYITTSTACLFFGEIIAKRQYTGLKDKNGVEIYEGDIVNKDYGNLSVSDCPPTAVEWGCGGDSDGYCHGVWEGWMTERGSSLADINTVCEVIGNIHENPELLTNGETA